MSDIGHNGGPAFPHGHPEIGITTGMSLRDWFAGQALANQPAPSPDMMEFGGEYQSALHDLAANCYYIADAMLAERGKS